MHTISTKDLISAELETVTTSRSPTTVITANGEVQTHEEATVYVKELDIFLTIKSSKTRQQFYRSESFAMNTAIPLSGSTVKNHISKTVFGYSATRRTSFRSCLLTSYFSSFHSFNIYDTFKAGDWSSDIFLKTVKLEQGKTCVGQIPIQYLCQVNMLKGKNGETRWPGQPKFQNQIKTKTTS